MGEHSKPERFNPGALVSWAKAHPKIVSAVVVGVVGVVSAVKPDFPGAAVIAAVHAFVGG
ncbi:hypothetical protein [Streptomyces sp. NPDC001876]|uniref:hypothetical protein n=1 Tax=Streptomyces sp. NPDC001876 TaxID=3154402 RepID=UPI003329A7BF